MISTNTAAGHLPSLPVRPLRRFRAAAAALAIASVAAGCGTGAYRERMERRIEQLRSGVPGGALLSDATTYPNTPLQLRVPTVFTNAFAPGSGPEKMQRKTPMVTVPGLLATWEAHVQKDGEKLPYYFYLALIDKSEDKRDPTAAILQEVQNLWSGIDARWNETRDPEGRAWQTLRIEADQDWVPLDASGKELAVKAVPGMLQFNCHDAGSHWIVAGWRVPRSIEKEVRIATYIAPVLGSLKIEGG